MADFLEILIRRGVVSPDQLHEAEQVAKDQRNSVGEALVILGYATEEDVMRAMAEQHGLEYINLDDTVIPPHVVELVPESVARENFILPLSEEEDALRVLASDPLDLETFDKLRFILNHKIEIALAAKSRILEAINKYLVPGNQCK